MEENKENTKKEVEVETVSVNDVDNNEVQQDDKSTQIITGR